MMQFVESYNNKTIVALKTYNGPVNNNKFTLLPQFISLTISQYISAE